MVGRIAAAVIACAPGLGALPLAASLALVNKGERSTLRDLRPSGLRTPRIEYRIISLPRYEAACQDFEITIGAIGRIDVVPVTSATCGTLGIALAADVEPSFDAPTRTVRLPIVLVNTSRWRLKPSATLQASQDSIVVLQ